MGANNKRAIVVGQSVDGKGEPRIGFWDIREIKTIQDINGVDVEVYDGSVRSESYEQLVNRKKLLNDELSIIKAKIDAIDLLK